jgi:hypothetical protein
MAKDALGTILTLGAVGVGGYFLYEWLITPATTAAASTPATPATSTPAGTTPVSTTVTTGGAVTSTPATPVATPVAAALPSLASITASIQSGAATDPNFTGSPLQSSGYRWQTYLNIAMQNAGLATPSSPTNIDLSQNMTFATYWAAIAPTLTAAYGLSGLFGYIAGLRGLGQDDGTVVEPPGFVGPPTPDASGNIPTAVYPASQEQLAALASQITSGGLSTTMWLAIGAAALLAMVALGSKK